MRTQCGLLMAVIVAGALAGLVCPASAQTPSAAGAWRTIDDKTGLPRSTVTISEQNGVYRGVVAKGFPMPGEQPRTVCDKCTGALANAPLIGLPLLTGLKRDGLSYSGGSLVDPDSGSVYSVKMTLSPDGQTLDVRGFIGVSLFGRSQTWIRDK